ncbi:MAG TPA: tripartite tricarboxylate transporter substrate binding protein [Burkholderiales bacterium]|nr:tripartite tricarboxylate transporter substrate binding protein [Burkholderiales bacterium]
MKPQFALAAFALLSCVAAAQTQRAPARAEPDYPSKPIRLIVPQAPGGSNDIFARYIGAQLAERVGRQVVVDNRPGAEGAIGTEIVARANPDGYTLLMASSAFTMNPAVRKLPYDPVKDFDWVAKLGNGPVVVTVGPALPVNSLAELLALGRSKPGYITIASAGGFMHFVSALFRSTAGIDAVIALYRGGAPALIDVIGGQAHMSVATIVTAMPHIRSGKLKALATGGAKRSPALAELPTIAEAGLPGYEAAIWWAFGITGGTPAAAVNRLHTEVAAILKLPETGRRFALEGAEVDVRTPAQMREFIPADLVKWAKVARDARMEIQN